MSFTSLEFPFFLGLCLGLLHSKEKLSFRIWLLILFSYAFCLSFGLSGVIVVTVVGLADFFVGNKIASAESDATRKWWLWSGIIANLAPLAFFKYSAFVMSSAAALAHRIGFGVAAAPASPALPIIGLSYFTFAGISYLLDIYYGKIEPAKSAAQYLCYLVYFPKLIAGPIVRAADFLPQLARGFRVTAQDIEIGCAYLLAGSVKKLVIADQLAGHVRMIMAAPEHYTAFTLVQGLLGYTVQIYADFSGYSDMAIGCARLMGIQFPQNFLMPYSSMNIAEFWRRWHVTMSNWFRDYVFLPLELHSRGMRNSNFRVSRNLVITMLLCGLWHGASWNFVVWGGFHGSALAIYQVYTNLRGRQAREKTRSNFHPKTLAARALTLSVVMLGYVFFGTQTLSVASIYLSRMLMFRTDGVALASPFILPITSVVFIAHLLINKDRNVVEELATYSVPIRVLTFSTLLLVLTSLVASEAVPFVYVHF
jgi:alginate O-acetyltransferase complex protein AlgI